MTNITESKTNIVTKSVLLNAQNSQQLANYYQTAIGLTLIEEENGFYKLGTPDGTVLLEIRPTEVAADQETTGMYHLAFLLPTYKDLGTILRHLIVNQIPVTGASDHGYSHAIYLNDPEGNGIEIYWDKPESEWDIREDGTIAGVTEPMDADAALEAASTSFEGLPNGTTMGHVHLHVDELENSLDFYTKVLGLGLKYKFGPAALFLASGDYHHHLGANVWKQGQLAHPKADAPGLEHVTWSGSNEDLDYIESQLKEQDYTYEKIDNGLDFADPAGIKHVVVSN